MSSPPLVGRLAPSPTGAQHIGNARTYLLAWLSIRSRGGRLIMRIEDIDSPRVKPGATQQAIDDLHWLGLDWDEGPDVGGPQAPYVQTERVERYRAAIEMMQAAEQVYPCTCTRGDIESAASAPHLGQEGPVYPRTCFTRRVVDAVGLNQPYGWRFRTHDEPRQLVDRCCGAQSARLASHWGDFIVSKMDGGPAYQLAVVVDDHEMGVTEVLRGDDLLPSAFRQSALYEFFAWQPPQFAHVPLVVGPDGRRLAKRHGDTRLSVLRDAGVSSARLVGLLAHSCGLIDRPEPVVPRELLTAFDLSKMPRQPWVFTEPMWQSVY